MIEALERLKEIQMEKMKIVISWYFSARFSSRGCLVSNPFQPWSARVPVFPLGLESCQVFPLVF